MMKSEKLLHAIGAIGDDLILAARPVEKSKKPRLRTVWAVAVAAALVLTLAIGVGATGALGSLENLFGPVFPGAQQGSLDPELIAKLGAPVGVSATDNGVTVTVDSMIRDRYNCTLVVTVEKAGIDGKDFLFDWVTLTVGGAEYTGGARWSSDPVSDDGKVCYVVSWADEQAIPTGKAAVTFENLVINPHRALMEQTVAGSWELGFDLDYEDPSADLPAGQIYSVEGVEVTLDGVVLSPLSLLVTSTAELTAADLETVLDGSVKSTLRERLGSPDIVITKKDGTRIANGVTNDPQLGADSHIRNGSGSSREEDGVLKCQCSIVFDQPIPLEELESVTIEGVEIPLDSLESEP